ncbi:hypothetical protein GCM10025791_50050 [Halioxenophilus aromaticivorans]|uniref:Uncharacterized protein n=1 Tax=Halioxenophilus aromaticivorans TaxID=1306992 RepID=A0AAV3UAL5_9ALTE
MPAAKCVIVEPNQGLVLTMPVASGWITQETENLIWVYILRISARCGRSSKRFKYILTACEFLAQ